jgi:hypothetical protein
MTPFVTNGTLLYISQETPLTKTLAGYNALTFTRIGGVSNFSDVGNVYETARVNLIGFVPHDKKVGTASQTIQLETIKITDAGQDLLELVTKLYRSASFKITTRNGEVTFFTAESSQDIKNRGEPNAIVKRKYVLNLTSEVLET